MKLLVIRHGESETDLMDVHEGRADFPLTGRGHRQAEAMARATGVPRRTDEHLMEFNNGLLAGMERAAARERYPEVRGLPPHAAVYGQVSRLALRFRADYILSKIISEAAPEQTVAIVSHGGMINQLYHAYLRLPIDSGLLFGTGDTGIHLWEIQEERRCVRQANDTAHARGV